MSKDHITHPTPHGRLIEADVNYEAALKPGASPVQSAYVVDPDTGVRKRLGQDGLNHLAELVRTQLWHEQAQEKAAQVVADMPPGVRALAQQDPDHPGVAPYVQELGAHRQLIEQTGVRMAQLNLSVGRDGDHDFEGNAQAVPTLAEKTIQKS